jgi:hypothetical protein
VDRLCGSGYTGRGMNFELKSHRRLQGIGRLAATAATLSAAVSLCPAAALAQARDDAALRAARDQVLDGGRYQTEPPAPRELPDIEPFDFPPWLAEMLYWGILAGVAALVLFFIATLVLDLLKNRTAFKRNREQPGPGTLRVETPPAERRTADPGTLAEADRLAAEGRFGEAIHLLLLVALERLRRELGPRVAPALTGREVLGLPALPATAAEPLGRMVQLSEINHFGGRAAAEPDYVSCRADFLRFSGDAPAVA